MAPSTAQESSWDTVLTLARRVLRLSFEAQPLRGDDHGASLAVRQARRIVGVHCATIDPGALSCRIRALLVTMEQQSMSSSGLRRLAR